LGEVFVFFAHFQHTQGFQSTATQGLERPHTTQGTLMSDLFNKKWIEQLPPNPKNSPSREKEYSDTQVVGLKLLVNKVGRKFFYLRSLYMTKTNHIENHF
jgi:hypothetical protein